MKVACVVNLNLILWLSLAALYWENSYIVKSYNPWECFVKLVSKILIKIWLCMLDIKKKNDVWKFIKTTEINNMHFCLKTKSTHFLTSTINISINVCLFIKYHFFFKDIYHSGLSFKWWEGICLEKHRSNNLVYATKFIKMYNFFNF